MAAATDAGIAAGYKLFSPVHPAAAFVARFAVIGPRFHFRRQAGPRLRLLVERRLREFFGGIV
jgi:hypothetical protein